MHCAVIYRCNERKPGKTSLWEKKKHITNTKIKTLGNKVNTESKNWEWDKYWIKTNTAADSSVNSNSAHKDWVVLTVEDEQLKQKAKKKSSRQNPMSLNIFYSGDLSYQIIKIKLSSGGCTFKDYNA